MALTYPSTSPPHDLNLDASLNNAKRKLDDISPPNPPKRTRTVGPFVMDDDDDDDDDEQNDFSYANAAPNPTSQSTATHVGELSITQPVETPSSSSGEVGAGRSRGNFMQKGEKVLIRTCSGKTVQVAQKKQSSAVSYEQMVAARSVTAPGKATKSYYGIDIHKLLDEAAIDASETPKSRPSSFVQQSVEIPSAKGPVEKSIAMMWTEKYRARKFKDLIGDERTHRLVLRWLKGWDPIVFPGLAKPKAKRVKEEDGEERQHRKVLLLAGPAGLGKTTLAHVCARQAGYEVLEINASDERSRDVVKGRIRDAVGTENVKGAAVEIGGRKVRKSGKPVCVVVDEVDGVVTGSGGGEGGFMKALVDLLVLDQKNSERSEGPSHDTTKKKKKGDKFRLLRPLILICNDVYHPSLRPLRTSLRAEIVHVRRVPIENVVQRMRNVFQKEGIQCDGDGVRKLCEASWGLSSTRDDKANTRGASQGDIRGVLVAAEWIAHQLQSSGSASSARLTKKWIEQHVLNGSLGDGSSRGLGRGGTKDIVERVFLEGAGFPYKHGTASFQDPHARSEGPAPTGIADLRKRHATERLREMVDAAGEYDRCITDCFLTYPSQNYQDDTFFSKPNAAYDWLHFHDSISSRVYSQQDWELNPYLSQPIVAFHNLFSSSNRPSGPDKHGADTDGDEEEHPFSGPRADFAAFEAEKQNRSVISEFRSSLSASLVRTFRSLDAIATELVPSLVGMLAPDVKPVVVGGSGGQSSVATVRKDSERALVKAAVGVMSGVGVAFEKTRVEMETGNYGGFVFRMEPPLDVLCSFSNVRGTPLSAAGSSGPVRYAIRQVLDHEYQKELLRRQAELRQQRLGGNPSSSLAFPSGSSADGNSGADSAKNSRLNGPKRDFFGRIIADKPAAGNNADAKEKNKSKCKEFSGTEDKESKVWVSYHEGFSNAVRKGISMGELLSAL